MIVAGRTVLVTGASGGIGHAIARELHRHGAKLVLSGRRADVLTALAEELAAKVVVADLSQRAAPAELAQAAGEVDALVANAGLPASGGLDDYKPEEIDRALDVNLRAPIQLARLLLPPMLERQRGALVFVSSVAGKSAPPGSSLYSATKYGLRGFALALRQDLHGKGVSVSTIFPGFISDAGLYADAAIDLPTGVGTRPPEDVAAAVLRGIEDGPAEIDVAPLPVRVGTLLSSLAPSTAHRIMRRAGAVELGHQFGEAQRDKR